MRELKEAESSDSGQSSAGDDEEDVVKQINGTTCSQEAWLIHIRPCPLPHYGPVHTSTFFSLIGNHLPLWVGVTHGNIWNHKEIVLTNKVAREYLKMFFHHNYSGHGQRPIMARPIPEFGNVTFASCATIGCYLSHEQLWCFFHSTASGKMAVPWDG